MRPCPALYGAQSVSELSFIVNSFRCFAMLMWPRWRSNVDSNSVIISFQWTCPEVRQACGRSCPLLFNRVPFGWRLHFPPWYADPSAFANLYFFVLYSVILHCRFNASFCSGSTIHSGWPVAKAVYMCLWSTTGFYEKFVTNFRNGTLVYTSHTPWV